MKLGMIGLVLAATLFSAGARAEELKGEISLSGAWALYPMVVKWAEEFKKLHPDVKIDIAAGGAGKGMADALSKVVDLGMVSREINSAEVAKGAWVLSVTKDAVVPVISEENPFKAQLLARGIAKDAFKGIWLTEKTNDWSQLAGGGKGADIHAYTRSDACGAAQTWAAYLGVKAQEDLQGVGVYGDPGLAEAVRKDPLGIGYNNVNYAFDAKTKRAVAGIMVAPIDIDGNGKLDPAENFYASRDSLVQAIAEGKYPSPPARELYLVANGKPDKPVTLEFLRWALTDGQKFVPETGYINLPDAKLKQELGKLSK